MGGPCTKSSLGIAIRIPGPRLALISWWLIGNFRALKLRRNLPGIGPRALEDRSKD